jgi:hypothetical protein
MSVKDIDIFLTKQSSCDSYYFSVPEHDLYRRLYDNIPFPIQNEIIYVTVEQTPSRE